MRSVELVKNRCVIKSTNNMRPDFQLMSRGAMSKIANNDTDDMSRNSADWRASSGKLSISPADALNITVILPMSSVS